MPERRRGRHDRFLLDGERVVVDVRQHWGVVAGPVAIVGAGLILTLWVDAHVRLDGGPIARALWLLWWVSVAWLLFQIVQWRHDRFLATDKRLLLDYGLFTTKVAMMPLAKVTDMSFERSVPGRVFGYGRFVLESAGQDQALRQVDWVRDPEHTYRLICAEIFGVLDDGAASDGDDEDFAPGGGPGPGDNGPITDAGPPPRVASPLGGSWRRAAHPARPARPAPEGPGTGSHGETPVPEGSSGSSGWSDHDDLTSSRAIPVRHAHDRDGASVPSGEVLYSSEYAGDEDRRRRRSADTGPIPLAPSADD